MKTKGVNRRRFLQYLATGMAMGVAGLADAKTRRIRAAAIQMTQGWATWRQILRRRHN